MTDTHETTPRKPDFTRSARWPDRGQTMDERAAFKRGEDVPSPNSPEPIPHRAKHVLMAQRAFLLALMERSPLTLDDVSEAMPPSIRQHSAGSVALELQRLGIIEAVGRCPSGRRSRNGNWVARWTLADRRKAEQWLRDHPLNEGDAPHVRQPTLFDMSGAGQ